MSSVATTMAKLSGLQKALSMVANEPISNRGIGGTSARHNFSRALVAHYFEQAGNLIDYLRTALPDWYEDFQEISLTPRIELVRSDGTTELGYSREQVLQLIRDLDQVFEIRANSELAAPVGSKQKRVFVSHGSSHDWLQVQAYIERDANIRTLELAQEPSGGKTIIEKLFENAEKCDSAVIVMTGDDLVEDAARVRENVMHEIGFFQGKFGRRAVALLHEDGVNIPSNLAGVVYVPFPKGNITAAFHVLRRELDAIYL